MNILYKDSSDKGLGFGEAPKTSNINYSNNNHYST